MKKKLLLFMAVLALFSTGCGKKNESETDNSTTGDQTTTEQVQEPVVVTDEEVIKDQVVDGLQLTNTSLVVNGGVTLLVTNVANNTGADYYLNEFRIHVKDEAGQIIADIPGYVGDVIPNGESRDINSSIDTDLSNAKSIEYVVDK